MKALNLKNMKETIINYSADEQEFEKIWENFYQMTCLGFISRDTWVKFFEACGGWYIEDDGENVVVRDSRCNDEIIWIYTPNAEYRA